MVLALCNARRALSGLGGAGRASSSGEVSVMGAMEGMDVLFDLEPVKLRNASKMLDVEALGAGERDWRFESSDISADLLLYYPACGAERCRTLVLVRSLVMW